MAWLQPRFRTLHCVLDRFSLIQAENQSPFVLLDSWLLEEGFDQFLELFQPDQLVGKPDQLVHEVQFSRVVVRAL